MKGVEALTKFSCLSFLSSYGHCSKLGGWIIKSFWATATVMMMMMMAAD